MSRFMGIFTYYWFSSWNNIW